MIIRNKNKKSYTVIDNAIIRDEKLTPYAKLILVQMLSMPDDFNFSLKTIKEIAPFPDNKIRAAIKELTEKKYIRKTPILEARKFKGWSWIVYEKPY